MAGEEIEARVTRILMESEQINIGEGIVADVITALLGPLGKVGSLIRIADAIDKRKPIQGLIHGIDLISPPILDVLFPANTLATALKELPIGKTTM